MIIFAKDWDTLIEQSIHTIISMYELLKEYNWLISAIEILFVLLISLGFSAKMVKI